ncbi:hypothetical protein LM601614_40129 [Listeria monocytogenes]|nr:hypothetical protein LM600983_100188 [Listeria monocytogenes]CUK79308.1 hypothetical protein LM601614_40129 [Listeria monocytogenes]
MFDSAKANEWLLKKVVYNKG